MPSPAKAANPSPARQLSNERQAAEHLNLSVRTLQQWRYRGCGPRYVKLGGAIRYRPEDLDAWLIERSRTSTAGGAA